MIAFMNDWLYIGIKGSVLCLAKRNGKEIWRTNLRSSVLVNVVVDGDLVYAYARGHLYGLDANTGDLIWENPLPGLGYGHCIIATKDSQTAVIAAQQIQAATAAASTAAGSS